MSQNWLGQYLDRSHSGTYKNYISTSNCVLLASGNVSVSERLGIGDVVFINSAINSARHLNMKYTTMEKTRYGQYFVYTFLAHPSICSG